MTATPTDMGGGGDLVQRQRHRNRPLSPPSADSQTRSDRGLGSPVATHRPRFVPGQWHQTPGPQTGTRCLEVTSGPAEASIRQGSGNSLTRRPSIGRSNPGGGLGTGGGFNSLPDLEPAGDGAGREPPQPGDGTSLGAVSGDGSGAGGQFQSTGAGRIGTGILSGGTAAGLSRYEAPAPVNRAGTSRQPVTRAPASGQDRHVTDSRSCRVRIRRPPGYRRVDCSLGSVGRGLRRSGHGRSQLGDRSSANSSSIQNESAHLPKVVDRQPSRSQSESSRVSPAVAWICRHERWRWGHIERECGWRAARGTGSLECIAGVERGLDAGLRVPHQARARSASSSNAMGGMPMSSSSSSSTSSSSSSFSFGQDGQRARSRRNDRIFAPAPKRHLPKGRSRFPFEIVVVCRQNDVLLHPGGYRLTTQAMQEQRTSKKACWRGDHGDGSEAGDRRPHDPPQAEDQVPGRVERQ